MDERTKLIVEYMLARDSALVTSLAMLAHSLSDAGILDKRVYVESLHALISGYQGRDDVNEAETDMLKMLIEMIESDEPPTERPRFSVIPGGKVDDID